MGNLEWEVDVFPGDFIRPDGPGNEGFVVPVRIDRFDGETLYLENGRCVGIEELDYEDIILESEAI